MRRHKRMLRYVTLCYGTLWQSTRYTQTQNPQINNHYHVNHTATTKDTRIFTNINMNNSWNVCAYIFEENGVGGRGGERNGSRVASHSLPPFQANSFIMHPSKQLTLRPAYLAIHRLSFLEHHTRTQAQKRRRVEREGGM